MRLIRGRRSIRYTEADLSAIKRIASISAICAQRGVVWDQRQSNFQRGDLWACCPLHEEQTASFHVDEGQGIYHCFGCGACGDIFDLVERLDNCSFPEAVRRVSGGHLPTSEQLKAANLRREFDERRAASMKAAERERKLQAVLRFLGECVEFSGSIADREWLRCTRHIKLDLGNASLRFHAHAPVDVYLPDHRRRPAMVAAITNSSGVTQGAQLTYLSPCGTRKADMATPRLTFGAVMGGLVHLGRVGGEAVIGEGVESTLSASEACGLPGLAALGTENLARAVLPDSVRRVMIAFDRDARGQGKAAADKLARLLWDQGRAVYFLPPPEGFADWNACAMASALPKLGGARAD